MGGDGSNHTDYYFTSEDEEIADQISSKVGDLFVDVFEDIGPVSKSKIRDRAYEFFYDTLTSYDQWMRVARALRVGGYRIVPSANPYNDISFRVTDAERNGTPEGIKWTSVNDGKPQPEREGKTISPTVIAYSSLDGESYIAYYSSVSGWYERGEGLDDDGTYITHWALITPPSKPTNALVDIDLANENIRHELSKVTAVDVLEYQNLILGNDQSNNKSTIEIKTDPRFISFATWYLSGKPTETQK